MGWRRWKQRGFHFSGGYTLVTLGGGMSGAELVAILTGKRVHDGSLLRDYAALDASASFQIVSQRARKSRGRLFEQNLSELCAHRFFGT